MDLPDRSSVRLLIAAGMVALAAGCGLDSSPVNTIPVVQDIIAERTFTEGDLEITERVTVTNTDIGTVYHLRALVLNRGADVLVARFEMLFQPEFWVESQGTKPGHVTLGELRVVATKELGTLFGGATASVALEAQQIGPQRVRVSSRLVPGV